MKITTFSLLLPFPIVAALLLWMPSGGEPPRAVPAETLALITAERARAHVDTLASDAMQGRDTPSPGLDSAAAYIAAAFRRFGLASVNGSYYHEYRLKIDRLGDTNALAVNGRSFSLKEHFIPYDFTATAAVEAPVVFAGFGITDTARGYDDYAGIDARGKIVLVIAGEPTELIGPESGTALSSTMPVEKMRNAVQHGAVGILILTNPLHSRTLRPQGTPWPSLYRSLPEESMPLRLDLPEMRPAIPAVGVSGDIAREIFGEKMERIRARIMLIDTSGAPASVALPGVVKLVTSLARTTIPVRNVVGLIPGSERPEEYIVIGAHYDHIGVTSSNPRRPPAGQDTIYNGADDNASGTTGLLLMAEALGALPANRRPARSILIVAFSGEEIGLYGSKAYVATSPLPIERAVAMVNMDMIGRNHPDTVYVGGIDRSPAIEPFLLEANRVEPMKLSYEVRDYFNRSDQASFAAAGVPVFFFYTGEHEDYHKVSDSPEKVDARKVARVSRLCLRTVWLLAESSERPKLLAPGMGLDVGR